MQRFEDLTGQRFGYWTVIEMGERSKTGRIRWKCKCDCGNVCDVKPNMLKSGRSKSCGCGISGKRNATEDLTGKRFGRLTVLKQDKSRLKAHNIYWICKCDCGNEKSVSTGNLRGGNVKSCGCLRIDICTERLKQLNVNNIKHGESGTSLYDVWHLMKQRCQNPNSPVYKWYGGKGVNVCSEWEDYEIFSAWAYTHGYEDRKGVKRADRLSIDRIDSNGDYCPENCRWITVHENVSRAARGKRKNENSAKRSAGANNVV